MNKQGLSALRNVFGNSSGNCGEEMVYSSGNCGEEMVYSSGNCGE